MSNRRTRIVADVLRQRVQTGLHLGLLCPGTRLASVREVSAELHAGSRSVAAAYRCLAAEGLVTLRPRSGVFVTDAGSRPAAEVPEVASWIIEVFLRGLSLGIAPVELRRQAQACLDTVPVRAACLECNLDQIESLSGQLRDDYGFETAGVDVGAGGGHDLLAAAHDADVVVTTRFHEALARSLGRRLRRPVLVATLDPAFVNEVRRLLDRGPVFWICTDPRFAAKLPMMFPGAPVVPVLLGRDPLASIPEHVDVYATRAAARQLPAGWRRGRVVTVTRAFSEETARALLVLRVRRNLEARSAASRRGH